MIKFLLELLGGKKIMAKTLKTGQIHEDRLAEAMDARDRLIIELLVSVLDEKLVIERHILKERMSNLVELSDYDNDLKDTLHALIHKL